MRTNQAHEYRQRRYCCAKSQLGCRTILGTHIWITPIHTKEPNNSTEFLLGESIDLDRNTVRRRVRWRSAQTNVENGLSIIAMEQKNNMNHQGAGRTRLVAEVAAEQKWKKEFEGSKIRRGSRGC